MADKLTDTQIQALAGEAASAGDLAQAWICAQALDGDTAARAECARVIASAAAQADREDTPSE